jgi:Protein of unknown function (DUF2905)
MAVGRMLIVSGLLLIVIGLLVSFSGRLPLKLGHLPGDIVIRGRHGVFYFPLATCILLSVLFSLLAWFLRR